MFIRGQTFHFVGSVLGFAVAFAARQRGAAADWATYQGNPAHTGYVPGPASPQAPVLLWKTAASSTPLTGLAVGDGTVFVTNTAYFDSIESLHALDEGTGAVLWSQNYGSSNDTVGAPAYANGIVYLQTDGQTYINGNYLHAYAARSGTNLFNAPYAAQWETYLNPTPYNGNIYVGGGYYGGIYSFAGQTGAQNWFGNVPQYDGWTPAVDQNYAYSFTGSGDTVPISGIFEMINRSTGSVAYSLSDSDFAWSGYTMGESVVLGSHNDAFVTNGPGVIYPNSTNNGQLIMFSTQADATHTPHIGWTQTDEYTGQVTLANGVLYVVDGGAVAALDELTGNKLWTWTPPAGSLVSGTMIATDNILFVGAGSSTYALDLSTHTPDWSYPAAGPMALSDNTLFIAGSDDNVYALSVPEPGSMWLVVMGLAALRRRRISPH